MATKLDYLPIRRSTPLGQALPDLDHRATGCLQRGEHEPSFFHKPIEKSELHGLIIPVLAPVAVGRVQLCSSDAPPGAYPAALLEELAQEIHLLIGHAVCDLVDASLSRAEKLLTEPGQRT